MKHRLLTVCLAVLLSAAVLIGGTLAFFTDKEATGLNSVVSGTLDVEVQFSTDGGTTWQELDKSTADDVILDANLTAPGDYDSVLLRIMNKGNLHLKYQLATVAPADGIVLGTNQMGGEIDLSKALLTAAFPAGELSDRTVNDLITGGVAGSAIGEAVYEGTLAPDGMHEMELIVFAPVTLGNEFNFKSDPENDNLTYRPYIDLGIYVIATQEMAESDSFDEKYDENADYPAVPDFD